MSALGIFLHNFFVFFLNEAIRSSILPNVKGHEVKMLSGKSWLKNTEMSFTAGHTALLDQLLPRLLHMPRVQLAACAASHPPY